MPIYLITASRRFNLTNEYRRNAVIRYIHIQARPLGRGPLRTPVQGDGLVCLVFNEYLSVQEVSSLELWIFHKIKFVDENRMEICVVCLMGGCPRVFFQTRFLKTKPMFIRRRAWDLPR